MDGWDERSSEDLSPVRFGENGGENVSKEDKGHRQKDLLDALVGPPCDQPPDEHAPARRSNPGGNAKEVERGGDTNEFGHNHAPVGEQEDEHDEDGQTQGKVLPNQVGEPFASHGTHPRAHLLDHRDADH